MSSRVWLRRAYEPSARNDGYRVLVDRIWPRGVSKEELQLDEWCHDVVVCSISCGLDEGHATRLGAVDDRGHDVSRNES